MEPSSAEVKSQSVANVKIEGISGNGEVSKRKIVFVLICCVFKYKLLVLFKLKTD